MVIGKVEMGDPMPFQGKEPFWLGTEDKLLERGLLDLCGRTLQVADDDIAALKHRIDKGREHRIRPLLFYHLTDTTVQQDITSDGHRHGVCDHQHSE